MLFLLLSLVFGCRNKSKLPDETANNKTEESVSVNKGPEIPGVPKEVLIRLLNECTYVDYIFHTLPFSISQAEDPSIDQNISFIDYTKPLGHIPKECKSIGRKFFHIKGEIVYDVDVYLTNNCKFYVFIGKDKKPMFANYMTEAGVKFYAHMAQQARGSMNQQ
ncbi:MAG: hypothetical protein H7X99_03190 [Saprospiraceae bacterium]|nr:hypothetical protein [Saprospiraceae bacterium]